MLQSAIVQAFVGAAVATVLLHLAGGLSYEYILSVGGRDGGSGLVVAVVFVGILAFRFGQQYLERLAKR